MTTPKQQLTLSLRRAPVMLRVVIDASGNLDTLDQLDDVIRPGETAYVYMLTAPATSAMVDGRDPKTGKRWGGHRFIGRYELLAEQPDQATLADNAKWTEWCRFSMDRVTPEWCRGRTVMP